MTDKQHAGQWKPGQSGNPGGKKPGSGELQKLRASIAEHTPSIIEKLLELAKAGDIQAARLILERVFPAVKPSEQTVELDLAEDSTLTAKAAAVLSAAATGQLAPGQAAQMIAALGTVAKIVETDDLAQRIKALEERNQAKEATK